jgi:acetolactate synthase-1/2/3 large subunit
LEKAVHISEEGRKGPVLIDIPIDLQYKEFDPDQEKSFYESEDYHAFHNDYDKDIDDDVIENIATLINDAKRPVILVGGGARIADVESELQLLLNKTHIPIVYSLMGKDLVKESYSYNLGFIGAYGNRCASLTLANSDLLIILGSRLDARQTGRQTATFAREAKIIQVDIDEHELDRKIKVDYALNTDVKSFLDKLNTKILNPDIESWQKKVLSYKEKYSSLYTIDEDEKMPNKIISLISQYAKEGDMVCVDVGLHQMWTAQSFEVKKDQRLLFSGGLGAMGCALPTAIGAVLGTGKRAIAIVGDGGFQMNIQELEVLRRRNLPIKIFIMNNAFLGMVRQMQTEFLNKNYIGTQNDYSVPIFKNIAEAYGIQSHEVSNMDEIENIIKASLQNDACELIDIHLSDSKHLVEPRLAGNRPMEDMAPFLDREEFKAQMIIKPLDE